MCALALFSGLGSAAAPARLSGARAAAAPSRSDAAAWIAAPPRTKVFLTVAEALELAFPKCEVERTTVYLDEDQQKRIRDLAATELDTAIVYPYVARRDGKTIGTAYFDTHRVRSLKETLMVVVDPEQKIARTELLAFAEPLDYIPGKRWYEQFPGKVLDAELNLRRGIKGVTGATLTARATTDAARRSLAIHQVLNGTPIPPPEPRGE